VLVVHFKTIFDACASAITITPIAEEWSGNGHCGQLCNTNTDMTSQVCLSSLTSFKESVAIKTMHEVLLTMWLDTMATTTE